MTYTHTPYIHTHTIHLWLLFFYHLFFNTSMKHLQKNTVETSTGGFPWNIQPTNGIRIRIQDLAASETFTPQACDEKSWKIHGWLSFLKIWLKFLVHHVRFLGIYRCLGGGFKHLLCSSLPGEDSHFRLIFFSDGLKPPTSHPLKNPYQSHATKDCIFTYPWISLFSFMVK